MRNPNATRKGPGRRPFPRSIAGLRFNYYIKALTKAGAAEATIQSALNEEPFADRTGAKLAKKAREQMLTKRC